MSALWGVTGEAKVVRASRRWRGARGVVTLIVFACCTAPAAASTTQFGAGAGSGKFNDIAVGPSGNVYALDTADHVLEFSNTGTLLATAGGTGSGTTPLQLHHAYSLAVDPSGNVFVADDGNCRLLELTPSLAYSHTVTTNFSGCPGSAALATVAAGSQYVYVFEWVNGGRIRSFNNDGTFAPVTTRTTTFTCIDDYTSPGAAIDPAGNLWQSCGAPGSPDVGLYEFDPASLATIAGPLGSFDNTPGALAAGSVAGATQLYAANPRPSPAPWSIMHYSPTGTLMGNLAVPGGVGALATDAAGNVFAVDQTSGLIMRIEPTPTVALAASPQTVVTGQPVTFSGAGSSAPLWAIADYRFDLTGAATYATDTGTTPTVTTQYSQPGTYTVGLRVTSTNGAVVQTSIPLRVTPAPPPGPVGVSINNGAYATNTPNVTINIIWPPGASTAFISNDGGFQAAMSFPLATSIPWRLNTQGNEQLPKTVYVRFDGAPPNYTDDIIFDNIPPRISGASTASVPGGAATAAVHRVHIRVKATDNASGLASYQLTTDRKHPPARIAVPRNAFGKLRATFQLTAKVKGHKPLYLRLLDRAGNPGAWRKLHA